MGFYSTNKVGTLWSVLYFYNTGVGGNGSHSSGSGRDGIFPQFFRGIGSGRDEFLWEWDGRGLRIHSRVTLCFEPVCMPNVTVKLPHQTWRANMDAAMKPPGLLQGKCIFKKLPNGNCKQFITTSYVGLQFKIHV